MKRISILFLSIMLIVLVGCSADTNSSEKDQSNLTVSLSQPSGGIYIAGAGMSEFVNNNSDMLKLTPSSSGGGTENLQRINNKQADVGIAFTGEIYNAWKGEDPFTEPLNNMSLLGPSMINQGLHFTVLKDSGINVLDDLKGKTLMPGAPGSTAAATVELFLDEVGLLDEINLVYYDWEDIPDSLKTGDIDGFVRFGVEPNSFITQIATTLPIEFVDLTAVLEENNIFENFPYWEPYNIPANSYDNQEKEADTFGMPAMWFVNDDLNEETIYELASLIYSEESANHMDNVYASHAHRSKEFNTIIELHPGAKKYWEEQGLENLETVAE